MQMRTRMLLFLMAAVAVTAGGPLRAETAVSAGIGSARVGDGDFEGSDTGYRVMIGSYGEIFGGELGYVDFGRLGGDGPSARAWAPAVTVGIPLGITRLYGKFGPAFADVEGSNLREEYRDTQPFYGVGLRTGPEQGLGFRLEYERYRLEREDVDMAIAGLDLRF